MLPTIKILKIGDKENRKEAIRDLAGFSFDDKVRESLKDVLLSDPDPRLRKQVAESLGKTTNKNVLPALGKGKEKKREAYSASRVTGHV